MERDAFRGSLTEVLASILRGTTDARVTCPRPPVFRALVDDLVVPSEVDDLRALVTSRVADQVHGDFFTATHVADFTERGMAVRVTVPGALHDTLVVTEDSAVSVLVDHRETVGVSTGDDDAVEALRSGFDDRWADADRMETGVPPRTALCRSMEENLAADVGESFEQVATSACPTRGMDRNVDVVDVLLLVAAKHEEQFYRISRWGEDESIASVTKFSQSKRRLEEAGLVDSEQVQTGSVGRPRQRLVLPESLDGASVSDVVSTARSVLVN